MKPVLCLLLMTLVAWLMWQKGLMVIQRKMAVTFIGRRGANHWGAGMTGCTGWTKRVLPLDAGKKYRFYYESNITDGDIVAEIALGKNVVRSFDLHNRTTVLKAEKGRYTITTRFTKASGEYDLKWEEI